MRFLALSCLLAGCSLVANPDDHLGEDGSVQGDAGMDAGDDAASAGGAQQEEVVDADFEEVDDDKKDKS